MTRNLLYIFSFICMILSLTSCGKSNDEPKKNTTRTIAIYMIATNTLSSCDVDDIAEIETAIEKNGMNNCRLLIYWVSKSGAPQLIEITTEKKSVKRVVHKVYSSDIRSTTIERMKEVFTDILAIAPAEDYGLILWSHASGWASSLTARSNVSLLDFGDDYGSTMPIDELAEGIPEGVFSFIYTDACYMSGVEVVYELRNKTKYFIGSVTELPIYGMNYTTNIPCFFSTNLDLTQSCKNTFNHYNKQSGSARTCTISLIDCSKLDQLAALCKKIHANGTSVTDVSSIQIYKRNIPYLFYDFVQYTEMLATEEQKIALRNLMDKVVIYKATTPYIFSTLAIKEENYSGLSTYILGTTQSSGVNERYYKTLSWYKDVIE